MKTIGENIAVFRKEKKLTQEELAEMMAVTAQAVSKWECDSSYPDVLMIERLAKTLDVTVDEILHGKTEMPVLKEAESAVIDRRILYIHTKIEDSDDPEDTTEANLRLPVIMFSAMQKGGFWKELLDIDDCEISGIMETLRSVIESGLTGPILDVRTGETSVSIEVIDHEA